MDINYWYSWCGLITNIQILNGLKVVILFCLLLLGVNSLNVLGNRALYWICFRKVFVHWFITSSGTEWVLEQWPRSINLTCCDSSLYQGGGPFIVLPGGIPSDDLRFSCLAISWSSCVVLIALGILLPVFICISFMIWYMQTYRVIYLYGLVRCLLINLFFPSKQCFMVQFKM